jgi:hypothetical protein
LSAKLCCNSLVTFGLLSETICLEVTTLTGIFEATTFAGGKTVFTDGRDSDETSVLMESSVCGNVPFIVLTRIGILDLKPMFFVSLGSVSAAKGPFDTLTGILDAEHPGLDDETGRP